MSTPGLSDLRTLSLFRDFRAEDLSDLAGKFVTTTLREGGLLFDIGDKAVSLYVLTAGEVLLHLPGEEPLALRPPSVIGELGVVVGSTRNARAVASTGAELWELEATVIQRLFAESPAVAIHLLRNLLEMAAHKVQRDQRRLADMRRNIITTQKSLKALRDLVLESKETPVSSEIDTTLARFIINNRLVNYRVAPPPTFAAHVRLDIGLAPVVELSRTHVTMAWPHGTATLPSVGDWLSGIADLAGTELVISGTVIRSGSPNVTIELDLLIDDSATVLEGYLTRLQLLDVLV